MQRDNINRKSKAMTQVESAARVQFEIAVKEASNCRHETYQVSCFSCEKRNDCEIQDRINQAKSNLKY